jgi:ubiquinone/menaquinone biosynthesis C-methylase UbiE
MEMTQKKQLHGDICPCTPWTAAALDNVFRSVFQNPRKIVGDYIRPGMTVMDIGCGPGFFSLAMAKMVGPGGLVISIDVQQEMLDLVKKKSEKRALFDRILLHLGKPEAIGIQKNADFILSFYMVHEVPDPDAFFKEVCGLLNPKGRYLIVEPLLHVSEKAFDDTLDHARRAGFMVEKQPDVLLSRAALLVKK